MATHRARSPRYSPDAAAPLDRIPLNDLLQKCGLSGITKNREPTSDGLLNGVDVRSKQMPGDSGHLLDLQDTLSRNPALLPLVDRLRRYADLTSKSVVSAKRFSGQINGMDITTASTHAPNLYQQFSTFNQRRIGGGKPPLENQPMVDKGEPLTNAERLRIEEFPTFTAWLRQQLKPHGMKARVARALEINQQNVYKWLEGSIPEDTALEALARWAGVDFVKLKAFACGLDLTGQNAPEEQLRWTETVMGAEIGRAWEKLNQADPAFATDMANILRKALHKHGPKPSGKAPLKRAKQQSQKV